MKLLRLVDNISISYANRIAFLTNFYREPLLRKMEQEFKIIRPEWTILICLYYQNNLNPRDICEFTEQPRNTISRAVYSLVEKGLITQKKDQEDARRKVLTLTEQGREMYEAIMPMFEEGEREMLACLSKKEREQLDVLLTKMVEAVPNWRRF